MQSCDRIASDACRIHLVRRPHGMNVAVRFRGRLDVPLDAVGQAEAREAAANLEAAGIAAVYSSPLDRALDVARTIANVSGVGRVVAHEGLVNLDHGEWEGLTKDESAARTPNGSGCTQRIRCGPIAQVASHSLTVPIGSRRPCSRWAIDTLGKRSPAVTRGAMVRLAVLQVDGVAPGDWQFKLPTGSATVFEVRDSTLSIVSVADRTTPDPFKGSARQIARHELTG